MRPGLLLTAGISGNPPEAPDSCKTAHDALAHLGHDNSADSRQGMHRRGVSVPLPTSGCFARLDQPRMKTSRGVFLIHVVVHVMDRIGILRVAPRPGNIFTDNKLSIDDMNISIGNAMEEKEAVCPNPLGA
jgi:hypothetical protein